MKRIIEIATLCVLIWCVGAALSYVAFKFLLQSEAKPEVASPVVYVDPATGVNYFRYWRGGICVRLTTNGTPYITNHE